MLKLKEYYLAHEGTGERVLVGYKVKSLDIGRTRISRITIGRRGFSQSQAPRSGVYQ